MNLTRALLVALHIGLAGFNAAVGQVSFAPAGTCAAPTPEAVIAAAIGGDGKISLVTANNGYTGSVTVFADNGNGGFSSNTTYAVANGTRWVTAADVNGDGYVDLISANLASALTVLTNDGNGNFGFNASLSMPGGPISVVAADLTGKGRLDLIAAGFNNDTVVVFTNNGFGVFGSNATYSVGHSPRCVIAADINGDGKPDLITANNYGVLTVVTNGNEITTNYGISGSLSVLTNNGNGRFSSNATYTIGKLGYSVAAADLNGDGKVDLIGAGWSDSTLIVLTNNGSGAFGSNATYTVGQSPASVVAADINGDGKLDLISANWGGTLSVLTNDGTGSFALAASLAGGGDLLSVAAADVNGDGKLDLIAADVNGHAIAVLTNTTAFPPPTSTPALSIMRAGNQVLVSWPSDSAGWSLQENADLTTRNWSPSGYSGFSISDDGTHKSLIVPTPPGSRYFRLMHP